MDSIIYRTWGSSKNPSMFFGDLWRTVNTALITSEETGRPVGISLRRCRDETRKEYILDLLGRIRSVIDSSGSIFFTMGCANRSPRRVNYPYMPTKNRWGKSDQDAIAFSLQVKSRPWRKLPPPSTTWPNNSYEKVMMSFCDAKFESVGLPLTMEQSMEIMLKSMFFFGFDSGMAHLARAMKIPTFIIAYTRKGRRAARKWHNGDKFLCEGTEDFLSKAKSFLQEERPDVIWTCREI